MCDCIKTLRAEIMGNNPKIQFVRFDLDNIVTTGGEYRSGPKTGQKIIIGYFDKIKSANSFITHKFCPWCGIEYK